MRLNAPKCQPPEMGFYLGFYRSGCRDLNSGPSVPQTVPAKSNPFPARRNLRNDRVPTTGVVNRQEQGLVRVGFGLHAACRKGQIDGF